MKLFKSILKKVQENPELVNQAKDMVINTKDLKKSGIFEVFKMFPNLAKEIFTILKYIVLGTLAFIAVLTIIIIVLPFSPALLWIYMSYTYKTEKLLSMQPDKNPVARLNIKPINKFKL